MDFKITIANRKNNEQSKKQKHKQSSSNPEIKIQPSLDYELEYRQLNYNLNCLNKYNRNYYDNKKNMIATITNDEYVTKIYIY